jgi:hypothetical protein
MIGVAGAAPVRAAQAVRRMLRRPSPHLAPERLLTPDRLHRGRSAPAALGRQPFTTANVGRWAIT